MRGRTHVLSAFAAFSPWFARRFGDEPTPGAVTESAIRAWRDQLRAEGKAVATIQRHLSVLRSYLIAAGRPVPFVEAPTQVPHGRRSLATTDVARIVHAAERERPDGGRRVTDTRDEALVETGLRVAEVVGQDVKDLDLGPRHGWLTVRGKGNKTRRVPLNSRARPALTAYLQTRVDGNPALFVSQKGNRSPCARRGPSSSASPPTRTSTPRHINRGIRSRCACSASMGRT